MTVDPVAVESLAEWLYERDWRSRRWPGEEAMRPRPTFAQLLTGETCKPPAYAHTERAEAQQYLADATAALTAAAPILLTAHEAQVVAEGRAMADFAANEVRIKRDLLARGRQNGDDALADLQLLFTRLAANPEKD